MLLSRPVRDLVVIWLAWIILLLGYQELVAVRFQPCRPDTVLDWTPADTGAHSLDDRPYPSEPFLGHQVAWDSEWYLSIATVGYDDPAVRTIYLDPDQPPQPYFTKNVSPPPIAVPARVVAGRPGSRALPGRSLNSPSFPCIRW